MVRKEDGEWGYGKGSISHKGSTFDPKLLNIFLEKISGKRIKEFIKGQRAAKILKTSKSGLSFSFWEYGTSGTDKKDVPPRRKILFWK